MRNSEWRMWSGDSFRIPNSAFRIEHSGVLLGEQTDAKPVPRGSTPRAVALRPRSVADSHATLRRSKTRFDSWRGHFVTPVPL